MGDITGLILGLLVICLLSNIFIDFRKWFSVINGKLEYVVYGLFLLMLLGGLYIGGIIGAGIFFTFRFWGIVGSILVLFFPILIFPFIYNRPLQSSKKYRMLFSIFYVLYNVLLIAGIALIFKSPANLINGLLLLLTVLPNIVLLKILVTDLRFIYSIGILTGLASAVIAAIMQLIITNPAAAEGNIFFTFSYVIILYLLISSLLFLYMNKTVTSNK